MKLVIVESPTKAKTLTKFLGSGYEVRSSMGHIRDLPKSGLGVDVEKDFKPEYKIISGKNKVIKEIKSLASKAESVYLATDPDREGEAIAYHVAWVLKGRGKLDLSKFKRVTFHEITKSAISKSLENPGVVDMDLVYAQQTRRILDRLVGYTLSPVLWRKVRRGLSAGRVQSVAVRLIVEKERERDAFVPKEFWDIKVQLETDDGDLVWVDLFRKDGKKFEVGSKDDASLVVEALKNGEYSVSDVVKRRSRVSAPVPFTTSILQQTASNLFGWSAKRTMSLAQDLYERGLITYHRTDSLNLAKEAISSIRAWIGDNLGDEYLPDKPRVYKTKSKSAQEAHEAIRPTNVGMESVEVGGKLNSSHVKLYELIRRRTIQCQMVDALYDKTKLIVKSSDGYELKAEGKVLVFDGWQRLNTRQQQDEVLPDLSKGDALKFVKIESEQKFTKPPARYTEAGLIKELEKRDIGRPSTYASIISTIQTRMYVEKEEKRFKPTNIGIAVTEFLESNFPKIMDYDFTANMESDLDAIADGEKEWVGVLRSFWKPFKKKVDEVQDKGQRVAIAVEKTGESCPKCEDGEVVIRTGRFGKFLSCSRFPECDYKAPYLEKVDKYACPECDGAVVVRRTRRGKVFYGCENYPKCKWAGWKLSEAKKLD